MRLFVRLRNAYDLCRDCVPSIYIYRCLGI